MYGQRKIKMVESAKKRMCLAELVYDMGIYNGIIARLIAERLKKKAGFYDKKY